MSKKVRQLKTKMLPILKQHHINKAAIFGSFARGEEESKSDVDLLVAFRGSKTLFDLAALKLDLEDALRKEVDVVTYRSLSPRLKSYVMRDAVRIL